MITVGCLKLFNVYAPSGSDKQQESAIFFGEQVFEALQLDSTFSFLLSGDFDSVLKIIDVVGGSGFASKKCPALNDLVNVTGLIDAF